MSRLGLPHTLQSPRGSTLVEVMLALSIGAVAVAFVGYLTLFCARSEAILFPQMSRQQSASLAMQAMSDLLANAKSSTIAIPTSNRINFQTFGQPSGHTSSIYFQDAKVIYLPNSSSPSQQSILAEGLESLSFSTIDQMIEIQVVFKYRKHRGYDSNENERLNGTFVTRVFPRNH